MVDVVCPHCGKNRTVVLRILENGKEENRKVKCPITWGGCGKTFYSRNNIVIVVPEIRTMVLTDKLSNKEELIEKICNILKKYKKELPSDILRGKLLELEAIGEMRKK